MLTSFKKSKEFRVLCRSSFIFLYILLLGHTSFTQTFELTPRLEQAYNHILSLEFVEGRRLLLQERNQNSSNYLTYHFENYIDFFTCFISEEEGYFNELSPNKNRRLKLIEEGDESSPYYLFSQAEILLQWALVRLKFEEYFTAIWEINKAIRLLEKNEKRFPNFIANKKSLSALHSLVGTIPPSYKYLLKHISSFSGTIEQGYREINEVVSSTNHESFIFYKESIAIKALIELHLLNDKRGAHSTISNESIDAKHNPLACFLKSNIYHKAGYNNKAIEMIQEYQNYPHELARFPFYYLNYQLGVYKLNRLDVDSDIYIRKYLTDFKGLNYIKEAYQKLAWYEWTINQSKQNYQKYMKECRLHGHAILDEDKQAKKWALSSEIPADYLLKARLLCDGGYFNIAKETLENNENRDKKIFESIEYNYRLGRVYQELGLMEEAERNYLSVLKEPHLEQYYFQTSASLYLGQLYEQNQQNELALKYYEKCLDMRPKQYKSSLHQKAKAGILRINP